VDRRAQAFGLATFVVGEGEKKAEITVSSAGGELLANVNRWRGQVGLPPVNAEGLTAIVAKTDTLGVKGDFVELVGPEKTILGVAATAGGNQYFIKLTGANDTAQLEKATSAFVKSLQLCFDLEPASSFRIGPPPLSPVDQRDQPAAAPATRRRGFRRSMPDATVNHWRRQSSP
jgi:hypothetical protein